MKELRPYQKEAVRIQASSTSCLNASGMGTGKTFMAVEHVRFLKDVKGLPRVLVVAPLNTHHSWLGEFLDRYPALKDKQLVYICGTPSADPENWLRMLNKLGGVFIIGWEAMRGTLVEVEEPDGTKRKVDNTPPWKKTGVWDLVIADEVHRLSERHSLSLKVMKRIKTRYKLGLSGTPARNRPEGLWGVLNWLWPDQYPSFWRWVDQYIKVEEKHIRDEKIPVFVGEKEPGRTFREIPCGVRYRWEDVADSVPEVVVREVVVPMMPRQERTYRDFEKQAFAWLDEVPVGTPLPLTQRIRLRQVALANPSALRDEDGELTVYYAKGVKSPKIEAVREIISDLEPGAPVLLFTHSRKFAEVVAHQLPKDCRAALWTGGTPQEERRRILLSFGTAEGPRVIVAVISAIGEGTDGLQRVCSHEIWLSQDDDGMLNSQAEARLNRSGQKNVVNRWYIHSKDTIDHRVYEKLACSKVTMKTFYSDQEREHDTAT